MDVLNIWTEKWFKTHLYYKAGNDQNQMDPSQQTGITSKCRN